MSIQSLHKELNSAATSSDIGSVQSQCMFLKSSPPLKDALNISNNLDALDLSDSRYLGALVTCYLRIICQMICSDTGPDTHFD